MEVELDLGQALVPRRRLRADADRRADEVACDEQVEESPASHTGSPIIDRPRRNALQHAARRAPTGVSSRAPSAKPQHLRRSRSTLGEAAAPSAKPQQPPSLATPVTSFGAPGPYWR